MKISVIVFCAALASRLIYILLFFEATGAVTEDSPEYLRLASQFETKGFLGDYGHRTPGYPVFLAFLDYFGAKTLLFIVFIQVVLDSLTCVITALIYKQFFSRGALLCGLLMALNLNMIIHTGLILPEILFLFALTTSLYFFVFALKSQSFMSLAAAMLLLAISTFIRPVAFYLYLIMPILLIAVGFLNNTKPVRFSLFVFGALIISAPIVAAKIKKNYIHYESIQFVSQGGTHLLNWVVPGTYQYSGLGSYSDGLELAHKALENKMVKDGLERLSENRFKASEYQTKVATQVLLEIGPFNIVKAWTVGSVLNLISPSLSFAPAFRAMDHNSFYMTPGKNVIEKLLNYVLDSDNILFISLLVMGTISSSIFLFTGFCGMVVMLRARDKQIFSCAILFFLVACYFLALTGPIIGPKYRIPIEPLLILCTSYFLNYLMKKN